MTGNNSLTQEKIYRLQNVMKNYQGRCVIKVDALDIYSGEVLAVVGPSGAGKSTLLRLLNFLEPPSTGSITYHGIQFNADNEMSVEIRRQVVTVFQRPMLLNLSVQDNVAFGLRLRGRKNVNGAVHNALEQVGLIELAHHRARTLSGGEAQRVALARAIVLEPEILLMDEPTANLDPANVALIESIASQLNKEKGTTLVLVTHNIFQARRLSQRVVFMLNGLIREVADTQTFFDAPSDPDTAAFVRGEMVY